MSLSRFDEIADLFDRVTETSLHWRLRRSVVASLGALEGKRVLDLGTGPGGLAVDLAAEGACVIGLDGSPEMLQRARERVHRTGRRQAVALIRGDAARLPVSEGSMDCVAGILVLHLVEDQVRALEECCRVLVPGGSLALVTQSDDFSPAAAETLDQPIEAMEREFLEGCLRSAESHPRLDRPGWATAFAAAGLDPPTITVAIPGVAWLLFSQRPGGPTE